MKVFMLEFCDDHVSVTFEGETSEDIRYAKTVHVPNSFCAQSVNDCQDAFMRVAEWCTDVERFDEPFWCKPDRVRSVEFDDDIVQLNWFCVRGGIEVQSSVAVLLESVNALVVEGLGDVEDIVDSVYHVLLTGDGVVN